MSEKSIVKICFLVIGALGLWLIIDVAGWLATIAGAGLMFIAATGLAGMVTFGSADRAENYGKSGQMHPSFQLSSVIFANKFNKFSVELSAHEINEVYSEGQRLAPQMKYQSAWDRPRAVPPEIEFPYCAVGEFKALFSILEERGDAEKSQLLHEAMLEFNQQFKDKIANLILYLF